MMKVGQSSAVATAKGRPLVVLAIVLSVWIGGRMMLWESPFPSAQMLSESAGQLLASNSDTGKEGGQQTVAEELTEYLGEGTTRRSSIETAGIGGDQAIAPLAWEDPVAPELSEHPTAAGSHSLIWMAAMSHLPAPRAIEHRLTQVSTPTQPLPPPVAKTDRWSLDAWAFWRDGGDSTLVSQARAPTYGASQAGAVLNYRLSPSDHRDPRAYARVYRAVIDNGESELAAGLSIRPLAAIPLRAHAELRATQFVSSTQVRPAAFVTTELPTLELPLGVRAEAYGQAGYVAGEAATAFADGQVHLLRDVQSFDLGRVSVGAAAWGGAQEGAQRLDIGPSVRADLTIGATPARVSLDYRERVSGDAEPPSGVAVTLSTRF